MKSSLAALLDAGRRFIAGLAMSWTPRRPFTQQQAQLVRRGFLLLGLTLACFLALHPPAPRASDGSAQLTEQ
jgi:hypothetical protein